MATECMSIFRQCEDRTRRGDAAQVVLTQRDQPRAGLRCDRARDQYAAAERPAQPFEPADQVDGGAGRPCRSRAWSRWVMPARAAATALSAASQAAEGDRSPIGKIASTPSPMNFSTSPPKA